MFKVQATYTNGNIQILPWEHVTKEKAREQIKLYKSCDRASNILGTKYKVISA